MSSKARHEIELPVGAIVDAHPARHPGPATLMGRLVTVAPLDPAVHAPDLYAGTHGTREKEGRWTYMADGPYPDLAAFAAGLRAKASARDPLFFSILDAKSMAPLGYAAYLRIAPQERVIEVGGIMYTTGLQRTPGATEAMYLMARHVFEDLGYRRYEWKCDSLNARSRRAALRLGFKFEGVFRQHMIIKGRNRDTAWFSMLDHEWPARKAALEQWLQPSNFDSDQRQKTSLSRPDAG